MKLTCGLYVLLAGLLVDALPSNESEASFQNRLVEGRRRKSHRAEKNRNHLKPKPSTSVRFHRKGHSRPMRKTPEYCPPRFENKKRTLHVSIDQNWTSSTTGSAIKNQTKQQRRRRDRDAKRNVRSRRRRYARSISISIEKPSRRRCHRHKKCVVKKPHEKHHHKSHHHRHHRHHHHSDTTFSSSSS